MTIKVGDQMPAGTLKHMTKELNLTADQQTKYASLPPGGGGLTVTDTMLATTDLLHALNVQMFELSMWQAMTGNCIAPHQRVDAPPT